MLVTTLEPCCRREAHSCALHRRPRYNPARYAPAREWTRRTCPRDACSDNSQRLLSRPPSLSLSGNRLSVGWISKSDPLLSFHLFAFLPTDGLPRRRRARAAAGAGRHHRARRPRPPHQGTHPPPLPPHLPPHTNRVPHDRNEIPSQRGKITSLVAHRLSNRQLINPLPPQNRAPSARQ